MKNGEMDLKEHVWRNLPPIEYLTNLLTVPSDIENLVSSMSIRVIARYGCTIMITKNWHSWETIQITTMWSCLLASKILMQYIKLDGQETYGWSHQGLCSLENVQHKVKPLAM